MTEQTGIFLQRDTKKLVHPISQRCRWVRWKSMVKYRSAPNTGKENCNRCAVCNWRCRVKACNIKRALHQGEGHSIDVEQMVSRVCLLHRHWCNFLPFRSMRHVLQALLRKICLTQVARELGGGGHSQGGGKFTNRRTLARGRWRERERQVRAGEEMRR